MRQRPAGTTRGFSMIETVFGAALVALAVLLFGSLYPTAATNAHMSGGYSRAVSAMQHKVDQVRAVGFGRLTYDELLAAGVIDTSPTTSPYHFEQADGLAGTLPGASGTLKVEPAGTDLARVTIDLTWDSGPGRPGGSSHEVTILVANE